MGKSNRIKYWLPKSTLLKDIPPYKTFYWNKNKLSIIKNNGTFGNTMQAKHEIK